MTTIDQELETLAEIALSEARRELEADGGISVGIWLRHADGQIKQLHLGEPFKTLMNDGDAKDVFFDVVRHYVEAHGITAVIFATDAWMGVPTKKQKQILTEENGPGRLLAMTKGKSFDEVEAMGLVERHEALVVVVQTASEVLIVTQFYERDEKARRIWWGERNLQQSPQARFSGRQKMYGSEDEETTQ